MGRTGTSTETIFGKNQTRSIMGFFKNIASRISKRKDGKLYKKEVMVWFHIYPENDIIDHCTKGFDCWCSPVICLDEKLIEHAPLDGRPHEQNYVIFKI